jgi:transposase
MTERICPRCGRKYDRNFSALSRMDNKTWICPDCGTVEALENWAGTYVPSTEVYWDDDTDQARAMRVRQDSQSPK